MAVCTPAAAALPASFLRPHANSLRYSQISSFRALRVAPVLHFAAGSRRLAALPRRRVLPRIEAKKQTFSSFDELLEKSDKPLLVDFYATWCGPCQFMVPILEEVSEQLKDKIQVVKIDTEKYTSIANRYQIEALPTFIIFKNGKPFDRFEGAMPAKQLIQRIDDVLKRDSVPDKMVFDEFNTQDAHRAAVKFVCDRTKNPINSYLDVLTRLFPQRTIAKLHEIL